MAGFAVWALVAGVIILMIFRIFGFYLGVLQFGYDRHVEALRDKLTEGEKALADQVAGSVYFSTCQIR